VTRNPKSVAHGAKVTPAAVFAFDLVALRGRDLRAMPLTVRKAMLKEVLKDATRVRYVQHIGENGVRLYQIAAELGIEGTRQARRLALPARAHFGLGQGEDAGWARD
jgi:bifunctional non-homologous end joining protein LigD